MLKPESIAEFDVVHLNSTVKEKRTKFNKEIQSLTSEHNFQILIVNLHYANKGRTDGRAWQRVLSQTCGKQIDIMHRIVDLLQSQSL